MDNKPKISFGFSKIKKPTTITKPKDSEVEIIDCVESNHIQIKGAVKKCEEQPLVIPLRQTQKSLIKRIEKPKELTLDELAAKELVSEAEALKCGNQNVDPKKISTVPLLNPDSEQISAEPTLSDYEAVPISDFGLAMLRGMGWCDGMTIGKVPKKITESNKLEPELRPKGLGLGASIPKQKPQHNQHKVGENVDKELILVKGAYGKIIAGQHKGQYCQIEGLDDENCRVIVQLAHTNEIINVNEFLVMPISSEQYKIGLKIINNVKYEQYKSISDEKLRHERHQKKSKRKKSHKHHKKHSKTRSSSRSD